MVVLVYQKISSTIPNPETWCFKRNLLFINDTIVHLVIDLYCFMVKCYPKLLTQNIFCDRLLIESSLITLPTDQWPIPRVIIKVSHQNSLLLFAPHRMILCYPILEHINYGFQPPLPSHCDECVMLNCDPTCLYLIMYWTVFGFTWQQILPLSL